MAHAVHRLCSFACSAGYLAQGGVLLRAKGGEARSLSAQPILVCVPSDLRMAAA